jgi:NTP pyrophosphatase (non-canonical NTP hydrolase)
MDKGERIECLDDSRIYLDTEGYKVSRHIEDMVAFCHSLAHAKGFWDNKEGRYDYQSRNVGELIALIHSELSEALEGHRKDSMDDHLPNRKMLEVELADAVIRIFDMAGGLSLDIGGAIIEKLKYNLGRPDKHGKRY